MNKTHLPSAPPTAHPSLPLHLGALQTTAPPQSPPPFAGSSPPPAGQDQTW